MSAMVELMEVEAGPLPVERFQDVVAPELFAEFMAEADRAREFLSGRTIWNVNSTAAGGGVAEMLRSLVPYIKGVGVDARWLVIPGNPAFFRLTKRIHNHLQSSPGDGGALDGEAREVYERTLADSAEQLAAWVQAGDIVVLHDPQTAGLVPAVRDRHGAHAIWRCHVGLDIANDLARSAWRFLLPYVSQADAYVFSRAAFAWEGLDPARTWVIPPSIDPFSPKNLPMTQDQVRGILQRAGVLTGRPAAEPTFVRHDGSEGRLVHPVQMFQTGAAEPDEGLVVQVSRWDSLKDPLGVMRGFAEQIGPVSDAHLLLAGPQVEGVADDPEGGQVLMDCVAAWGALPAQTRDRIHLAVLPMADGDENAALVNAIQRHATIVVQKSLAEGFGLTVSEAMWKGRPVVASRIGGIQDQIEEGRTGLLIQDPRDLSEFSAAVRRLLDDQVEAERIGSAARERVREQFLGPRHLLRYAQLARRLVAGEFGPERR